MSQVAASAQQRRHEGFRLLGDAIRPTCRPGEDKGSRPALLLDRLERLDRMTLINFPILKFHHADAITFVEFWGRQYTYGKEYLYDDNIGQPVTDDSLRALFEWKNGSVLSAKKKRSIEQYLLASERVA